MANALVQEAIVTYIIKGATRLTIRATASASDGVPKLEEIDVGLGGTVGPLPLHVTPTLDLRDAGKVQVRVVLPGRRAELDAPPERQDHL